ncbi:MAG: FRG domain-containing protein [Syntrophaceae bacterium]|nr:FRG domain-containing protein [Syntrophaceae bacterium]
MKTKIVDIPNYQSIVKKNGIIKTRIEKYFQIERLLETKLEGDKDNWIFRGQKDATWSLESSIERIKKIRRLDEKEVLEYFQKSVRGRRPQMTVTIMDEKRRELDDWALGRHYGLNTPLLDWTYSPYVALFFAFAEKTDETQNIEYRTVFALDKYSIEKYFVESPDRIMNFDFFEPQDTNNSRLLNQQGIFTINMSPYTSVEDYISHTFKSDKKNIYLVIIYISNKLREMILKKLNWMNINYLTLYPDITGAALHTNLKYEINDY